MKICTLNKIAACGIDRLGAGYQLTEDLNGADGVMVEVHNDPPRAKCDGKQSITPDQFDDLAAAINAVLPFACRKGGENA